MATLSWRPAALALLAASLAPNAEPERRDWPAQSYLDRLQAEMGLLDATGASIGLDRFHVRYDLVDGQSRVVVPAVLVPVTLDTCSIETVAYRPRFGAGGMLGWQRLGRSTTQGLAVGPRGSALFDLFARKRGIPDFLVDAFLNCDSPDDVTGFNRDETAAMMGYGLGNFWQIAIDGPPNELRLERFVRAGTRKRLTWNLDIHDRVAVAPRLGACFEQALAQLDPLVRDPSWVAKHLPSGAFVNLVAARRRELANPDVRGVVTTVASRPFDTEATVEGTLYIVLDDDGGCELRL